MDRKRKGFILLVFAVALTASIFLYVNYIQNEVTDPWIFVPENTALVVQVDNAKTVFEKVSGKNKFWQIMLSDSLFNNLHIFLGKLDSIDTVNFQILNELFQSPMLMSFQTGSDFANPTSFLLVVSYEKLLKHDQLTANFSALLNDKFVLIESSGNLKNGFIIKDKDGNSQYYLAVASSNLLITSDYELMIESLKKKLVNENHFSSEPALQQLRKTAGKNVDVRIFYNYENLANFIPKILNNQNINSFEWLSAFGKWTETDLLIKNEKLIFSGYTFPGDSGQFLTYFKDQKPITTGLYKLVPSNATFLLILGSENLSGKMLSTDLKDVNKSVNFDVEKLRSVIGNEVAIVSLATQSQHISDQSFTIFNLKDKNSGLAYLNQIASNSGNQDLITNQNYTFRKINSDNFLSQLFGNAFKLITENWYTSFGDYVIFANSPDELSNYISMLESENTLDRYEDFISIKENLTTTSNITLFIKPVFFKEFYLNEENVTNSILELFLNYTQGISVQLSQGEPFFYTTFFVHYADKPKEENTYNWKIELEGEIIGKALFVEEPETKSKNILVYDNLFNLYLINTKGELLWKKSLDSAPMGEIYVLNQTKKEETKFIFNTKDFIYQIDSKGENRQGFPLKISPAASNSVIIADYGNKNDTRLFVAKSDRKIYNYSLDGKLVKGWIMPVLKKQVREPIVHLVADNKDFIIITDENQHFIILDRKGNPRIKLKDALKIAINSTFYENKTNNKGIILTTDPEGNLVYISTNGKVQKTEFGEFSPAHFFLYEDFNGDNVKDFIFADKNKLSVFDRFKKELLHFEFPSEINEKPVFFNSSKTQKNLVVFTESDQMLYLFDNKGNSIIKSAVSSSIPILIGKLTANEEPSLITSSGNFLFKYPIK